MDLRSLSGSNRETGKSDARAIWLGLISYPVGIGKGLSGTTGGGVVSGVASS